MSSDGSFRFMSLPPELRRFVYEYALIAIDSEWYSRAHVLQDDLSVPTPELLRVSKQVNLEARDILYACNAFTTRNFPKASLCDPRQEGKRVRQWANALGECHSAITEAVSTIFTVEQEKVSLWLMPKWDEPDPVLKLTRLFCQTDHYAGNDELCIDGLPFIGFLRTIGSSNALQISTIELRIGDMPEAVDLLALYVEILKQHMTGLKIVVIDFGLNYNVSRSESAEDFGLNAEGYAYQATHMMPLFYALRSLIRGLPRLTELELPGCPSEMSAMAAALMDEQRNGSSLDVWQEWSDLLREAKESDDDHEMCTEDEISLEDLVYHPLVSAWEDITLLEQAHHGRIKIEPDN